MIDGTVDDEEQRKLKHSVLIQNKKKMHKELMNKGREINFLLDLFNGKLTLEDILDNDIPLLRVLRDTRIEMNEEISREQKNQQQVSKLTRL